MSRCSVDREMSMLEEENCTWLMFLGCVTAMFSLVSGIPNCIILVRLTKSHVRNTTLVFLRSCACADIMITGLFLIFVCSCWFSGEAVYDEVVCSVGGFLITWSGLSLHYGLFMLVVQRTFLVYKLRGSDFLRDYFRGSLIALWVATGAIAAIPFVASSGFSFDSGFNHCVIALPSLLTTYDTIELLLPSVLTVITAVQLCVFKPSRPLLRRSDQGRGLVEKNARGKYRADTFCQITSDVVDERIVGMETTLAITYICVTSSLIAFMKFSIRTYGLWADSDPNADTALSTSHLFTFVSGITRSMSLLIIAKVARSATRERRDSRHSTRGGMFRGDMKETSSSNLRSESRSSFGAFTSFTLFMSPRKSRTYVLANRFNVGEFWSETGNHPYLHDSEECPPCKEFLSSEEEHLKAEYLLQTPFPPPPLYSIASLHDGRHCPYGINCSSNPRKSRFLRRSSTLGFEEVATGKRSLRSLDESTLNTLKSANRKYECRMMPQSKKDLRADALRRGIGYRSKSKSRSRGRGLNHLQSRGQLGGYPVCAIRKRTATDNIDTEPPYI